MTAPLDYLTKSSLIVWVVKDTARSLLVWGLIREVGLLGLRGHAMREAVGWEASASKTPCNWELQDRPNNGSCSTGSKLRALIGLVNGDFINND